MNPWALHKLDRVKGKKVDKEELRDCPFCGGNVRIVRNSHNQYYVACTQCDCIWWAKSKYPMENTDKEMVIDSWNRRVTESQLPIP